VQKHPLQAFPGQGLVQRKITIFLVAGDRITQLREMHADLVRSPRTQFRFEQTEVLPAREQPEHRMRRLALLGNTHPPLTRGLQILEQRQPNIAQRVHPAAADQHQVTFVGAPRAAAETAGTKHLVQRQKHRALLAKQQDAGGFTVQPVCKFEKTRLWPLSAQGLDYTEAFAAAAMHGDAGRLVDHQQAIVFEDHRQVHLQLGTGNDFVFSDGDAQRRHAQQVTALQAVGNLRAPTIDAHLAAAHDAIDVALGHPLAFLQQQIVEPLSVLILGNQRRGNGVFANFGHFEYTSFVLRLGLKEALTRETVERRRI
jgi:hypothetical protein